ncbi:MAG: ABC transporter ATP-binding protein [Myxococcota bacterium]
MIEVANVVKVYRRGKNEVRALDGVSFDVPRGQFVSVMGSSGSGKSTMLNLLGALDVPTSGALKIDGREISKLPDDELSAFRRDRLGFIFQFFNLLPTLNALENVILPELLAGKPREELEPKARALLEQFGLKGRETHRPDELSGGQMQRVAIARALLSEPALLLADEPTGNLDSKTGAEVLRLIREATRERKLTVVMVTHDPKAAAIGDRIVQLADGRVLGDDATGEAGSLPSAH